MPWRSRIKARMPVLCRQGERIGTVEGIDGPNSIRLSKDSTGRHHWIPLDWVAWVDRCVHLKHSAREVMTYWLRSRPPGTWREAMLSERVFSRRRAGIQGERQTEDHGAWPASVDRRHD